jgi:hypothetical protein
MFKPFTRSYPGLSSHYFLLFPFFFNSFKFTLTAGAASMQRDRHVSQFSLPCVKHTKTHHHDSNQAFSKTSKRERLLSLSLRKIKQAQAAQSTYHHQTLQEEKDISSNSQTSHSKRKKTRRPQISKRQNTPRMGICQSREKLHVVAPDPTGDIAINDTIPEMILSPTDLALRLNSAKSVEEAMICIVSELSRITNSSAILILNGFLENSYYAAADEEIDLEDNAQLFAKASQLCIDANKNEIRLLYSSNLVSDARFATALPSPTYIGSMAHESVLHMSSMLGMLFYDFNS